MDNSKTIEEIREVLLEQERSRQKEIEERILAESLINSLQIISDLRNKGEDTLNFIFKDLKKLIPFENAAIAKRNQQQNDTLTIIYQSEKTNSPILNLETSEFIKKIALKSRNVFDILPEHGLTPLVRGGSCIIISFEQEDDIFYLFLASNQKSAFIKKHLTLAVKISSVIKQALINMDLVNKLIYSDKMATVGAMAGGIAHEINNPLSIIETIASIIQIKSTKRTLTPEILNQELEKIHVMVERISQIIKSLRVVSHHSDVSTLQEISIQNLLSDVLILCKEKVINALVEIKIDFNQPEFQSSIICDRVQISQVFLNLIKNSLEAISSLDQSEKWIKINIIDLDKEFCIQIIDGGKGIPEHLQGKIFNPFFTSKGIGEGTGLGLSISKNLMQKMHGDLKLNTSLSNTCFEVIIPKGN